MSIIQPTSSSYRRERYNAVAASLQAGFDSYEDHFDWEVMTWGEYLIRHEAENYKSKFFEPDDATPLNFEMVVSGTWNGKRLSYRYMGPVSLVYTIRDLNVVISSVRHTMAQSLVNLLLKKKEDNLTP